MKKKILISFILVLMILCNIKVYATSETAKLPSKYDLRNDINIRVENQGKGELGEGAVCFDYAMVKMVETYLAKTKGINYNLSETFFATHKVGNNFVLESDFPNKPFAQIPNIDEKIEETKKKAVVTDFKYTKYYKNGDIEKVKRYIQSYGGVVTGTDCDKQIDNYKGGIYRSKRGEVSRGDHAVLIIGWDDNYSKDNFVYEKPKSNGAWLVLNSWSADWGNNGTAWLSYEDYSSSVGEAFIECLTLSNGETIKTELPETEQERIAREKEQVEKYQKEKYQKEQQEKLRVEIEGQKKRNIKYLVVGGIITVLFSILLICNDLARKILGIILKVILVLMGIILVLAVIFRCIS